MTAAPLLHLAAVGLLLCLPRAFCLLTQSSIVPSQRHCCSRLFVAGNKPAAPLPGSKIRSDNPSSFTYTTTTSNTNDIVAEEDELECVIGTVETNNCLSSILVSLPRHRTTAVNSVLEKTEQVLREMHSNGTEFELSKIYMAKEAGRSHERIYANNYVDLGKIDT